MATEPRERTIIRDNFRWANGFAILWVMFTVILFLGGSWLFDEMRAPEELRTPAAVLLSTIVIVHAIWMAAGMALAHFQETVLRENIHAWGSGLR